MYKYKKANDGKEGYYKIKKFRFWIGIVLCFIYITVSLTWIFGSEHLVDLLPMEMEYFGRGESLLEKRADCWLCGDSEESSLAEYRMYDTVGIIVLNDFSVFDLGLKFYDEQGQMIDAGQQSCVRVDEKDGISLFKHCTPYYGRVLTQMTIPEDYTWDRSFIESHLCQACLDKVTDTLTVRHRKYMKKDAIPLCLIDFKTKEIYGMQDWNMGYQIGDYWISLNYQDNRIDVDGFLQVVYDER